MGESAERDAAVSLPAIRELSSALEAFSRIEDALGGRRPALFLDYDGTLAPIVDDPARAFPLPGMRELLERLRGLCPLAVVSGRDLERVRDFLRVDGIWYAGSHGVRIREPDGTEHERARDFLPAVDRAEERLSSLPDRIPGVEVERKRFGLAVHFRGTRGGRESEVEEAVDEIAREDGRLKKSAGKKVFELRPDLDWDKGSALRWILQVQGLDVARYLPLYVGDDVTDEDAFRVLASGDPDGIGIVVRGETDERPTRARFSLADPEAVRRFLERLAPPGGV